MSFRVSCGVVVAIVILGGEALGEDVHVDLEIDSTASVVLVRESCEGLVNCFPHLGKSTAGTDNSLTALNWIHSHRKPTASTPLLVDIGPGTWGGFTLSCPTDPFGGSKTDEGYITFRGAGQATTEIVNNHGGTGVVFGTVFLSGGCKDLVFESMTIRENAIFGNGFGGPVVWWGAGNSKWVNIELLSEGPRLWYDACSAGEVPEHYFFSSKFTLTVRAADHQAFRAECGKTWFFGSEIAVFGTADADPSTFGEPFTAFFLTDIAQSTQLFGTLVRVVQQDAPDSAIAGGTVYGAKINVAAAFHMHGGNMRVSASGATDAVGIDAGGLGVVHTPGNAFVVEAPGGDTTRLAGNPANLKSPFLWQPSTSPPVTHSKSGADLFVETDCTASGDCSSGDEPHLMVYNDTTCSAADPWFDTVTSRCRNDTVDPVADELADHEQRITDLEAAVFP